MEDKKVQSRVGVVFILLVFAFAAYGQDTKKIEAKIILVEKDARVRIDAGSDDRVKVGDTFEIYSLPEIIFLPGTKKRAYKKERVIGRLVILEVLKKESVARVLYIAKDMVVKEGMRVIYKPEKIRKPLPPYIGEKITLSPKMPRWGMEIKIKLNVSDLDNDLDYIKWACQDGYFVFNKTTVPENIWYAPIKKGKIKITVEAVDRKGLKTGREFEIVNFGTKGLGRPKAFVVKGVYGSKAKRFVLAEHISCYRKQHLFILDSNLRRIIGLDKFFNVRFMSGEYGYDSVFTRCYKKGKSFYLLDRFNRCIKRYAGEGEIFEKKPTLVYGKRTKTTRGLKDPVDFCIDNQGFIWVLDSADKNIKIYRNEGVLQATLGGQKNAPGGFINPVSIKHIGKKIFVLDSGRQVIMIFENMRFQREVNFKLKNILDFVYDPATQKYAVISSDSLWIFKEGQEPLKISPGNDLAKFNKASGLAMFDNFVYVICENKRTLLKFDIDGNFLGRRGGIDLTSVDSISVPDINQIVIFDSKNKKGFVMNKDGWIKEIVSQKDIKPATAVADGLGGRYEVLKGHVFYIDKDAKKYKLNLKGIKNILSLAVGKFGMLYLVEKGGRIIKVYVKERLLSP